jgi:hypothetical protein
MDVVYTYRSDRRTGLPDETGESLIIRRPV